MISLKKYLDMEVGETRLVSAGETEVNELLVAAVAAYRSALLAMGGSGVRACPGVGAELQRSLADLVSRLDGELNPKLLGETDKKVNQELQQWGNRSADYYKAKANEIKELLIVLARTAQSVGERDQRYTNQFTQFTTRLQTIADLEDLAQVRSSLVEGASELKSCVDQMARESHESVNQLRAEVSTYENKLKAVEELASRDALTGLANRRSVEERVEWRIAHEQRFSVMIVDLNQFKQVNDTYGHLAGDSLLKQFSQELRSNLRSTDIAGRWGGDEFILVLDCDLVGVKSQLERMRKWVFGEYTLETGGDKGQVKVTVDASVGAAQWERGETMQSLIEQADAAMYKDKQLTKKARL